MTTLSSTPAPIQQGQGVLIRRSGNLIELSGGPGSTQPSLHPDVRHVLEPLLTYEHKRFLYGLARLGHDGRKRHVEVTHKQLYRYDQYGRLLCGFGLLLRVREILQAARIPVAGYIVKRPADHPRPDCYLAEKARVLRHFHYKARQEECLDQILTTECGVVWAVTGFGKMVMIAMSCLALPNAKIDIVTKRLRLVNKLHQFLTRYIPSVGQVDGSHKRQGRVTIYSAASLAHSNCDADVLLCDEGHELLAEEASASLARYRFSRNYTFTASPRGRLDGADIRLESLFGRPIFYLPYPEAVSLGLVVPIRVEWADVLLDRNPCSGMAEVPKKRWGIWQNDARNRIVADLARKDLADDDQVMVTVETIEHAIHLRKHLPDFTLVYDKLEPREFRGYQSSGLLPADEPVMTPRRKEWLRQEFEAGHLKKAIATGVWHVGIDPVQLACVVRAEASGSETMDTQIPGRVSRTYAPGGKTVGILRDLRDQFDEGLARKAKSRSQNYKVMGWEQILDAHSGEVV